jgi:hypothetical protein
MDTGQQSLETLRDIKTMMERSSRFISLSGLSGVAAGICALAGAYFANGIISRSVADHSSLRKTYGVIEQPISIRNYMGNPLLYIATVTFTAALLFAFLFTWLRSKKTGTPIWGPVSRRLTISMLVPMGIGALYILKLMQAGSFGLIAPGCLIFYGLALVSASRYTLGEIKWLGYAELFTGAVCLFYTGNGLYFWAFGFGILHIVYGFVMWYRYER